MANRHFPAALVLVALAAGALLVSNCSVLGTTNDYFPLAERSRWIYRDVLRFVHPDSAPDTLRAVGLEWFCVRRVTLKNGEDAWEMEGISEGVTSYRYWQIRGDAMDSVFIYESLDDQDPLLWLVKPFTEGRSWDFGENGLAVAVGLELVEVEAGKFEKCWKIYFEQSHSPTDRTIKTYTWFAPDVGMVKSETTEEWDEGAYVSSLELLEYGTE